MCKRDLPDMHAQTQGPHAQGLRAYISGKSQLPKLQVICNAHPLYTAMDTRCDCGILL